MRSVIVFFVSFMISFTVGQLAMRAYAQDMSPKGKAYDYVVIMREGGGIIFSGVSCPDGGHLK